MKVRRSVVIDESNSDSQGLHCEVQAGRRDSKIVARRTEIGYEAGKAGKLASGNKAQKMTVTLVRKSGK